MNLSACGWSADCGVGRELIDAVANLPVSGAFILTHTTKRNRFDGIPENLRYVSGGRDPLGEMRAFVEKYKPDVMLTWEFPALWKPMWVRWVQVIQHG